MYQHECRGENDRFNVSQISRAIIVDINLADRNSLSLSCLRVDDADFILPDFTPCAEGLFEHYEFHRSRRRGAANEYDEGESYLSEDGGSVSGKHWGYIT